MTDIKDLALRVAKEVALPAKHITFANEIGYGFDSDELADFAQRFLAAYLAEQEPVAWLFDTEEDGKYWYDRYQPCGRPVFAAPLPEPAPQQEPVAWAREWEGDVSDIGNMIIEWNKEDCDDNPNWFPLFTVPPLPEPAPLPEQGCAECGKKASAGWALYCVKCAEQIKDAPLPEDVLEMVERLRVVWGTQLGKEAADMIERIAVRIASLKEANDDLASAAILPDGMALVQKRITEEGRCILATLGNYRTYQGQWDALVAAGSAGLTGSAARHQH